MMTLSELFRSRSSVRQYDHTPVPDAVIRAILEDAAWAPSAGNMQPWKVAVLSGIASQEFRQRYEDLGWESVLPSLRVALLSHNTTKTISSDEINRSVLDTYERLVKVTGNPSLIAICYDKPTLKEFIKLSLAAGSLYRYRMKQVKSPVKKLKALLQMLLRSRRDYRIAQQAVQASLANFSYGITLAARQRGLDSCIQFSYNHAYPWLRTDLQLSAGQRLFCVVLVGTAQDAARIDGVQSRTRRPVPARWIQSL